MRLSPLVHWNQALDDVAVTVPISPAPGPEKTRSDVSLGRRGGRPRKDPMTITTIGRAAVTNYGDRDGWTDPAGRRVAQ